MSSDGFDIHELTDFEQELIKLAVEVMPRESKKFLNKEGTKLKRCTLNIAKEKVKKKTGNYYKSIKKGKVYKYNDSLAIRCYASNAKDSDKSAPHAHLIEYGHRLVTKDGREIGWVDGKFVFEESEQEFQGTFFNDCEDFIDEVLDKGLH